jgi:hypothetical protein
VLQDELFPKPLATLFFGILVIIFKFLIVAFLHVVKLAKVSFFLILMLLIIIRVSIGYLPVTVASPKLIA